MRRWAIDRLRLAARWAWNRWGIRLFVFAHMPTKREMDGLWARFMASISADLADGAAAPKPANKSEQGKTLH